MKKAVKTPNRRTLSRAVLALLLIFILLSKQVVFADRDYDPGYSLDELDLTIQTNITEYALSFVGDTRLQYFLGGRGGRTLPLEALFENHARWYPGTNERETGTDCSAFVSGVYHHFGYIEDKQYLTTETIYTELIEGGRAEMVKSLEEMKPGYILMMNYTERHKSWGTLKWYGHTSIYLGSGFFVHISNDIGWSGTKYGWVPDESAKAVRALPTYPFISKMPDNPVFGIGQDMFMGVKIKGVDYGVEATISAEELREELEERDREAGIFFRVSEEDLRGMPGDPSGDSMMLLELADREMLSAKEQQAVVKIGEDISSRKEVNIVGIISSTLGILLLSYTSLLYAALIFDKVNTLFDGSLLSVLTFGAAKNVGDLTVEESRKATKKFILATVIAVIAGLLLISGLLLKWVLQVVGLFNSVF